MMINIRINNATSTHADKEKYKPIHVLVVVGCMQYGQLSKEKGGGKGCL